ncbi:MAG: thioesterase family protein [Anaerolineae bacterium]|nr:thioesterase family protein [Anaerolineae bacterium]
MSQPASENLRPGLTHETATQVTAEHLASVWGSGLAEVLATPALVALCEACAWRLVAPYLEDGQGTVGTHVDIRHLAATPPDMTVTVRVELVEVDGRRLRFRVEAWDDLERVATGEHERFIIDEARFTRRVAEKKGRAGA